MRHGRRSSLALAGTLLALAGALPVAASAAETPANVELELKRGRYHVSVGNLGQTVVLAVEAGAVRSLRRVAVTSYAVHGRVSENRLEADFGPLGEISMRFHPVPRRDGARPPRGCRGLDPFVVRRGSWRGLLRFRGEGGYLRLDVRRVRGSVETVAPGCRGEGERDAVVHGGRGERRVSERRLRRGIAARALVAPTQQPELGREVPVVQAYWRRGVAGAEFIAGAGRDGSVLFASTVEARGRVAVFRSARAELAARAVSADSALTRARVTPSSPFHGSARYRAAADGSRTWSGFLTVNFPGAPRYPLTGAPFRPSLGLYPELLVGLIGLTSG